MKYLGVLFLLFFINESKVSAQNNNILITEVFADPTPSKGLPEKEYIELYNNSSQTINLKGYSLTYGVITSIFQDIIILPKEYIIVCRKGNELDFLNIAKVATLTSFSLANEGNLLILRNPAKEDCHFVNYSNKWYSTGKDQGYALEMVDINFPCLGGENWKSSTSIKGGTPGAVNSVLANKPDGIPPKLVSFSKTGNVVELTFNEYLSESSAKDVKRFSFEVEENKLIIIDFNRYEPSKISLIIEKEIVEELEIVISGLEDCSKNVSPEIRIKLLNLPEPSIGDILISEILFNPFTGGSDFVEIVNVSKGKINLNNWKIANRDKNGIISEIKLIADYDYILDKDAYLAISSGNEDLNVRYPYHKSRNLLAVPQLPKFNNDEGIVILLNKSNELYDEFRYNEKMHNPSIKDVKGVSLERQSFDINKNSTWLSSSSVGNYASPGYMNSQSVSTQLKNKVTVLPEVFNPYQTNDKKITVLEFDLIESGALVDVKIFDRFAKLKKVMYSNTYIGNKDKLEWDGKDDTGQIVPVGYYFFDITIRIGNKIENHREKVVVASMY